MNEAGQNGYRRVRLAMLQFEQVKGMILVFHPWTTKWEARSVIRNRARNSQ